MSFMLTTAQYQQQTKDVTRRAGWTFLKPGDRFQGVRKGMGLKAGEHVDVLGVNVVLSVRFEPLDRLLHLPAYGHEEVRREGFPHLTPAAFVEMFCASHKGCRPWTTVTRIAFSYLPGAKQ